MRKFRVTFKGEIYEVEVEEISSHELPAEEHKIPELSLQKNKIIQSSQQSGDGEEIKAPMSGKVIDIRVKKGERVERGEVLLILEAMKMENEIPAPVSGFIKEIYISKDQTVEADNLLLLIG